MKVNRFWPYRWVVLRWGLFALALGGQAAAVYSWLPPVPPVPRWVVRGEYSSRGLSPDGTILRTQTPDSSRSSIHHRKNDCWVHGDDRDAVDWVSLYAHYGPVQFWDIAGGRLVRRFFDDASSIDGVVFSRDGTTMYAVTRHESDKPTVCLHAVDVNTGEESQAQVPTAATCWNIRFSPRGELLLLERHPGLEHIRDDVSRFRRCWRLYDSRSLHLLMTEDSSLSQWQWARDGDALLLYDAGSNGKSSLRRINTQGETVTQFDGAGAWLILTPDGKTLLTAWPTANEDEPGPSVLLWDPATGQRLGEIPRRWPGGPSRGEEALLADGRTMVITQNDAQGNPIAAVWNIDKQARAGCVPQSKRYLHVASQQDRFALYGEGGSDHLALYKPQPLTQLWKRRVAGNGVLYLEFLRDADLILANTGAWRDQHVELIDAATGVTRLDARVYPEHLVTRRGRYMQIFEIVSTNADTRGWFAAVVDVVLAKLWCAPGAPKDRDTIVRIFDMQSGEQLFRFEPGNRSLFEATPDGRSVIMYEKNDDQAALVCYDMPLCRDWPWIIGVPLVSAVIFLALGSGWRRLCQRRKATRKSTKSAGAIG